MRKKKTLVLKIWQFGSNKEFRDGVMEGLNAWYGTSIKKFSLTEDNHIKLTGYVPFDDASERIWETVVIAFCYGFSSGHRLGTKKTSEPT